MRHGLLIGVCAVLFIVSVLPISAQLTESIDEYWRLLLSPSSRTLARGVNLTDHVTCTALWRTPEFYIARKMTELMKEDISSEDANKALEKMFEEEVPQDRLVFTVVFRWLPIGPEYTLPPDMGSGVFLSNNLGIRVEGQLEEPLMKDLRMRANGGEYRSMIVGFQRKVPQGNRGSMVDILENAESLNLFLSNVKKGGKPVHFSWRLPIKYPWRPHEMALLIDHPHGKYRVVY